RNYEIGLPNGEMFSVFGDMFSRHLGERYGGDDVLAMMRDLTDALLSDDVRMIESSFSGLLKESIGSLMLDDEHVYQAFITGLLLHLSGRYRVSAEFERGNGRYDIMLESRNPDRPHIVLEIKRSRSDTMADDATKALEQIVDRDYTFGLRGDAILYGIAFKGKETKVLSEKKML
ncbi:MAG: PD-(D/E)XK nuclease domain-containing protein, partial [Candidatus Methanomethylophilaceae archaeon]|nr:PD-(D/E)XK nuclease domain-containing protein [Candidatus Methanomethylophilaceae archaeon]